MAISLFRTGLRSVNRILEKSLVASNNLIVNTVDSQGKVNHQIQQIIEPSMNYAVVLEPLPRTPCVFSAREYSKKSKHRPEYDYDSDSDDELDQYYRKGKQQRSERGNTDFWRRKMRTLHGVLDVNNDGVISFDDFMLLAKKFADIGNLTPETQSEFMSVMRKTWEEQWGEINPYNLVTAEQFLTDMHHGLNDKELVKKIHKFLPYLFKAVDIDHSGYLNLDQYKLFFRCLDLTAEDAAVAFAVIDENGDGKLTLKEFVKLGRDYFLTEDERRVSRMFWGPLVNH